MLEHPSGEPLERAAAADPRRVAGEIREVLVRLHAARVVHGAVDARHVVVGRARACLRIALAARASDPQLDWAGLDAIGGRAAR